MGSGCIKMSWCMIKSQGIETQIKEQLAQGGEDLLEADAYLMGAA